METLKKYPVLVVLIVLNFVIFLVAEMTGGTDNLRHMLDLGAAYTPWVEEGQWWRLFTCMFLHFGTAHLVNNMLVLFVLGLRMEPLLGSIRFAAIYLGGGLAGNVLSMLLEKRSGEYAVSAGASGAVFALMGAMIFALIIGGGHVQDLSTRQVLVMAVMSLYLGFVTAGTDNAAHVGGLIAGFVLAAILYRPKRSAVREVG